MNTIALIGTHFQTIRELKHKFLLLTDSDLLLLENKQAEILNRLHKKPYRVKEKRYPFAEA